MTGGMLVLFTAVDGKAGLTGAGRDEEFHFRFVEREVPVGHL